MSLKKSLLLLVKRHFSCISLITNFIKVIVKLWCWIILILNNWRKWCVISKKQDLTIDPCSTLALICSHLDVCPFRTTLWNLFDRNFLISFNKSHEIPKGLTLNIKLGNLIFSNALDISKNFACNPLVATV